MATASEERERAKRMGENLRQAFELFDAACLIQRQNLLRRYPEESEDELQRRFERWLTKADELIDDPVFIPRDPPSLG